MSQLRFFVLSLLKNTYMSVENLNLSTGWMHHCGTNTALAYIPIAMIELEGISIQSKTTHHGAYDRKL